MKELDLSIYRKKRKLEEYGGDGFGGLTEEGKYSVKFGLGDEDNNELEFKKLSNAIEFYNSLYCDKFFWDLRYAPELIDGYFVTKRDFK